jgi:hypothetical protein
MTKFLTPNPNDEITQGVELPRGLKIPGGKLVNTWFVWLSRLYTAASTIGESGLTADRPTKNLFVGEPYFDLTLGKPIWVKSLNPTVWVDATGGAV